jgi:hypothetical protein
MAMPRIIETISGQQKYELIFPFRKRPFEIKAHFEEVEKVARRQLLERRKQ